MFEHEKASHAYNRGEKPFIRRVFGASVEITEKGTEELKKTTGVTLEKAERIASRLGLEETGTLIRLLDKLTDILREMADEEGGLTLALTLCLRDNERPLPAAVITMSAWTNLNYRRYTPPYVGKNRAEDPYISPVYGEYGGFPPMLMQVGGDEALLNDTLNVARRASDAGVAVRQTTYPGMFHVFQMLFPELREANDAWDEAEAFIKEVYEA